MAAEVWDKGQGKWIYDKEIYSPATGEWAMDSDGKSLKPTDWDLVKAFKEQLSATESRDNGMITVAIKSFSSLAARQWV
jgi:hypothetical protein